jgi:hypothetical protein
VWIGSRPRAVRPGRRPPESRTSIDPLRRFELGYPALGAALNALLDRPLPEAASKLLALIERELAGRMPAFPRSALAAVRRRVP